MLSKSRLASIFINNVGIDKNGYSDWIDLQELGEKTGEKGFLTENGGAWRRKSDDIMGEF